MNEMIRFHTQERLGQEENWVGNIYEFLNFRLLVIKAHIFYEFKRLS